MSTLEIGKSVTVHYTGRFEDGTIFDTSLTEGREPLRTVLGQGSLIKGFESGLIGMSEGEKKTVEILPQDGYGEYLDGLVDDGIINSKNREEIYKKWKARIPKIGGLPPLK